MWGIIALILGGVYGFAATGKQDKSSIFVNGLVIGLVVAGVFALIGVLSGAPALGIGSGLSFLWDAIIITLLFILGVFLGDLLEGARSSPQR